MGLAQQLRVDPINQNGNYIGLFITVKIPSYGIDLATRRRLNHPDNVMHIDVIGIDSAVLGGAF